MIMQETAGKVMIELKETITPKDEVTQDTPDVVSSSMMPIDKIKSSDYKQSKIEIALIYKCIFFQNFIIE